jgi:hypothetical protein
MEKSKKGGGHQISSAKQSELIHAEPTENENSHSKPPRAAQTPETALTARQKRSQTTSSDLKNAPRLNDFKTAKFSTTHATFTNQKKNTKKSRAARQKKIFSSSRKKTLEQRDQNTRKQIKKVQPRYFFHSFCCL